MFSAAESLPGSGAGKMRIVADFEHMSAAGRAAALRAQQRQKHDIDAVSRAGMRSENEDDDGYDPYSDYMDMLARSSYEEPEADPWG